MAVIEPLRKGNEMNIRCEDDGWHMDLSQEEQNRLLNYAMHATWDILFACGSDDNEVAGVIGTDGAFAECNDEIRPNTELTFEECLKVLNALRFGGDGDDTIRDVAQSCTSYRVCEAV